VFATQIIRCGLARPHKRRGVVTAVLVEGMD
jgi:hypothetical protein